MKFHQVSRTLLQFKSSHFLEVWPIQVSCMGEYMDLKSKGTTLNIQFIINLIYMYTCSMPLECNLGTHIVIERILIILLMIHISYELH